MNKETKKIRTGLRLEKMNWEIVLLENELRKLNKKRDKLKKEWEMLKTKKK